MGRQLEKISEALKKSDRIALLTHVSLDGDCLGAGIALALALKNEGKEVYVVIDSQIPGSLEFLPGKELVTSKPPEGFIPEMSLALDCGDMERFADRKEFFDGAYLTANIDHHRTNNEYAELNFVDIGRSSTSELVYDLLKEMGIEITKDIATCLYVGLVTDTGGFKYGNTNTQTFICASELLGFGINIATLSEDIFEYSTESMLRLKARALSSLELFYDKRLAIVSVSKKDFDECGAARSETEGFADYGRALPSVVASVALREFEVGKIKISMRSKGAFDVAQIAQRFDGGGHTNAAGCSIDGSIQEAKTLLIEAFLALRNG